MYVLCNWRKHTPPGLNWLNSGATFIWDCLWRKSVIIFFRGCFYFKIAKSLWDNKISKHPYGKLFFKNFLWGKNGCLTFGHALVMLLMTSLWLHYDFIMTSLWLHASYDFIITSLWLLMTSNLWSCFLWLHFEFSIGRKNASCLLRCKHDSYFTWWKLESRKS